MRETTSLIDVDRAFGKWLRLAFKNTVAFDEAREENASAIKFFARPDKEKVFMFDDFGTPSGFVRRFERAAKANGIISSALPAVYYSVGSVVDAPALSEHTPEYIATFEGNGVNWDIEMINDKAAVEYRVVVCAWDYPTLTTITLALRAFLRQSLLLNTATQAFRDSSARSEYGLANKFNVKTMLLGIDVDLEVNIDSLGSEMLSRSVSASEERRLLTNTVVINVLADVVTGFTFKGAAMGYEGSIKELIK